MKKIMMVGKSGCGKTTLSQRLAGEEVTYQKTQSTQVVGGDILDTPGKYLEQRQFYNALVVTAVSADVILLLVSAVDEQNPFPPYLHSMFCGKPVIGIITKTDLAEGPEQVESARTFLELAGAEEILQVGCGSEEGVWSLKDKLKDKTEEAKIWEDIL